MPSKREPNRGPCLLAVLVALGACRSAAGVDTSRPAVMDEAPEARAPAVTTAPGAGRAAGEFAGADVTDKDPECGCPDPPPRICVSEIDRTRARAALESGDYKLAVALSRRMLAASPPDCVAIHIGHVRASLVWGLLMMAHAAEADEQLVLLAKEDRCFMLDPAYYPQGVIERAMEVRSRVDRGCDVERERRAK